MTTNFVTDPDVINRLNAELGSQPQPGRILEDEDAIARLNAVSGYTPPPEEQSAFGKVADAVFPPHIPSERSPATPGDPFISQMSYAGTGSSAGIPRTSTPGSGIVDFAKQGLGVAKAGGQALLNDLYSVGEWVDGTSRWLERNIETVAATGRPEELFAVDKEVEQLNRKVSDQLSVLGMTPMDIAESAGVMTMMFGPAIKQAMGQIGQMKIGGLKGTGQQARATASYYKNHFLPDIIKDYKSFPKDIQASIRQSVVGNAVKNANELRQLPKSLSKTEYFKALKNISVGTNLTTQEKALDAFLQKHPSYKTTAAIKRGFTRPSLKDYRYETTLPPPIRGDAKTEEQANLELLAKREGLTVEQLKPYVDEAGGLRRGAKEAIIAKKAAGEFLDASRGFNMPKEAYQFQQKWNNIIKADAEAGMRDVAGRQITPIAPGIPIKPPNAPATELSGVTPTQTQGVKANFQERVIAGQDFTDEVHGIGRRKSVNPDGTITLYHGTDKNIVGKIREEGLQPQSFLSLTKGETTQHIQQIKDKDVIEMKVDARDIELSSGTQEIYTPDGLVLDKDGIWKSPKRIKTDPTGILTGKDAKVSGETLDTNITEGSRRLEQESLPVEEFVRDRTRKELFTDPAYRAMRKKADELKLAAQAGDNIKLRAWRKLSAKIDRIDEFAIENKNKIQAESKAKEDLALKKSDPSIDNLTDADTKVLITEAKKHKEQYQFEDKMRGSASQYGEYDPSLRKYVKPESKLLYEITDLDPDDTITVYRGIDAKHGYKINNGDYVTTDPADARQYVGPAGRVIKKEVKAKHLINEYPGDAVEGGQFYELMYQTKPVIKITDTQIANIYTQAHTEQGVQPPKPPKEPWEMTKKEYRDFPGEKLPEAYHFNGIVNAIREGKPVPPEVLADYPELTQQKPPAPKGIPQLPKDITKGTIFTDAGQEWTVTGIGSPDGGIAAETPTGKRVVFHPDYVRQKPKASKPAGIPLKEVAPEASGVLEGDSYMNEIIDYNGVPQSRDLVMQDLLSKGLSDEMIEAYMKGAKVLNTRMTPLGQMQAEGVGGFVNIPKTMQITNADGVSEVLESSQAAVFPLGKGRYLVKDGHPVEVSKKGIHEMKLQGAVFSDEANIGGGGRAPQPKGLVKTPVKKQDIHVPEAFHSTAPAFNDHVNYFSSLQLDPSSPVRKIQKQMQVVNGKRLSGKLTTPEANKKIIDLKRKLMIAAGKEGIAVRMTTGGKVMLALRDAGTYVPVEFAEYDKFKDVRNILGGGSDITRAVQNIDGARTVKDKLNLKGQAGPAERYVLWPTREMMIQKIRYIDQKGARLLLINQMTKAKPGGKTDTLVNDILREITNRDSWMTPESLIRNNTKIRELSVNPNVVGQAQELRKFYDEVIAEQNSMREIRGQDPIPYRGIYSPEILRDATLWEKMMNQDFSSEQVSKGDLPDYIKPNKPFNPRELARKHGIPYELRVKSALDLAEKYVATAAKDIFNTSIIQNNKAFIQQLETMGLMGSAQVLSDWTSRAYGGVKPPLDRHLALPRWGEKALNKFNRVRNLAVFPLNLAWSVTTQTSSLALTIGRFGSVKTAQGLYNWLTSPKLRKEVAEDYYSYIIKAQKGGRLTRQDSSNLVGQKVKVYKSALDIANDAGTIVLDQMEKLLTGTSIEAGRLWGKKRGLTGDALKQFASDAGAKTQSMYNDEDKPQLLTNLLVKSITPYQTFAFELVNTMREWSGQTGTPPNTKMDRMWTIIRFIAAAAVFQAIARKVAKKDVYSWKNPPLPFAEYWWTPIASSIAGDGFQVGSSRNLPSPVLTVTKIGGGIKTFIENGESRKLRNELLKYGPGFFGVGGGGQLSRTVDAIWAYAEGGVYDKNGKRMFVINEQNLPRSIFSGVWSTEGGQHYLGKQSEAPDLEKSWWKQ